MFHNRQTSTQSSLRFGSAQPRGNGWRSRLCASGLSVRAFLRLAYPPPITPASEPRLFKPQVHRVKSLGKPPFSPYSYGDSDRCAIAALNLDERSVFKKVRDIGPYSKPNVLAKLDARTKEGRHFASLVAHLTEFVGGKPSAIEQGLIHRAAWLSVRIALMDRRVGLNAEPTERERNYYLAWSNALTRTLSQLERFVTKKPKRQASRLEEHLNRIAQEHRAEEVA